MPPLVCTCIPWDVQKQAHRTSPLTAQQSHQQCDEVARSNASSLVLSGMREGV